MTKSVLGYLGLKSKGPSGPAARVVDEDDPGLMITGEELIASIYENIRLRRSVLVTGPRGCGKTYCSEQAILRARDHGVIGDWRFLQGNREIPRDTLSEDQLIVGQGGRVELLTALALRPSVTAAIVASEEFPDWPGIPTQRKTEKHDPRTLWTARDWVVLFLDEINRFGDGFLDSLLSLIEEGKIVRRGQDFYVPIIVVATANPPGYDVTAKKLSPPLQARITRAFRVSQPDAPDLVQVILPSKIAAFEAQYPPGLAPTVSSSIRFLAAGATLCLWGDPDASGKGVYYLTSATRRRLREVMKHDKRLAEGMRRISDLIDFGPDARAVSDWIGCAMAFAARQGDTTVDAPHLEATAIHVLGHKLRERFNEGADPGKGIEKERLVLEIVQRVMQGGRPNAFGFEEARDAPRPQPPVSVRLDPEQFLRALDNYPSARAFSELLAKARHQYAQTLLRTDDLTFIWLNTVDAVLHPYGTQEKVAEAVAGGFWGLYRAHAPGQQLDTRTLEAVGDAFRQTFEAVGGAANPAGQERAAAAVRAIDELKRGALASPAHPQNAPGRNGMWKSGPSEW